MDIVTHAGIGLIAAAPVLNSHPELALGLVAGSVLPDLDAFSRVFGKRAYLYAHQTWSHALPVHAVISALAGAVLSASGYDGRSFGIGLFAALAFHTLLDLSNTLGVKLFAPFSKKPCCGWNCLSRPKSVQRKNSKHSKTRPTNLYASFPQPSERRSAALFNSQTL